MATAAQVAGWAAAGGFAGGDLIVATAVGLAAGANPDATGGVWGVAGAPGDGAAQGRHAHTLYTEKGWSAFPAHTGGQYALYLPVALTAVSTTSVVGAVASVDDTAENTATILRFATDQEGWRRVAKVVIGLALIALGSAILVSGSMFRGAQRVAGKAADVGDDVGTNVAAFKAARGKSIWE